MLLPIRLVLFVHLVVIRNLINIVIIILQYQFQKSSITSSSSSSGISPLASIVFPRKIKLTSIEVLRQSIDEECDTDLLNIIRNFVYVGTIDGQSSLIQHDTQLYLVHTRHLSQELFYQLCLYHFGNMGTIRLEPEPPSIEVIYIHSVESYSVFV